MHGNTSHENREIPGFSRRTRSRAGAGAQREVRRRTPLMHEPGKSDSCVVPQKVPNKAWRRAAERLEGRRLAKRNSPSSATHRTLGRAIVSLRGGGYGDPSACAVRQSPFDARQEPGAVVPHAGICGGGGQQWPSLLRLRSEARAELRLAPGGRSPHNPEADLAEISVPRPVTQYHWDNERRASRFGQHQCGEAVS